MTIRRQSSIGGSACGTRSTGLNRKKILLYGDAIPFFDFGGAEVVAYENSNVERMKKGAEEDQARAQAVADMAAEGEALPPTSHP